MRTLTKRSLAAATGVVALAGGALVLPGIATAQEAEPQFYASPTTVKVGEEVAFTATGCVADGIPQDEMAVVFTLGGGQIAMFPTDQVGNVPFGWTATEQAVGTSEAQAFCVHDTPDDAIEVFAYDQTFDITVVAAVTPTTAAPSAPTTAPAAKAAQTSPAFTG